MKRYLNRNDRDTFYIFFAFSEYISAIANSKSYFATGENQDLAKQIAETTAKFMENVIKDVDEKTVAQILKESKKMEVVAKYKAQAVREAKDTAGSMDSMVIKVDDFYEACEFAFMHCKGCRKKNKRVEECGLRRVCMEYLVPPAAEEPEEGRCQYRPEPIKKKGKEE